jgi:putative thiamine transport system permease protein
VTARGGVAGWAWLVPALLYALPLLAALLLGLQAAIDANAWRELYADTQFMPALGLSLGVGVASTLLALAAMLALVTALHGSRLWQRLHHLLGPVLAVPHAAFAVGLALLLMPSGMPARALALVTRWATPPDIATVQDPAGLALVAGLVLKELPFLLWNVAAQLQRVGQGAEVARQLQIAASMGYAARSAWARVLWPQLLPRLALPLLAVWAYSLTVVDMALVLGPTRPPTLALLAWQWLLDADEALNRQGAAAALLLTAIVGAGALLAIGVVSLVHPLLRARRVRGDRPRPLAGAAVARGAVGVAATLYAAVFVMLAFVSVAGVWSFPALLPQTWTSAAWLTVVRSGGSTLTLTASLALASATTGVLLAVAWMETTPAAWDRRAAPLVFAPMLLPGVLLVAGLYRLTLGLAIDGRASGLWLAHSLYTAPYVLVALAPAYRGFDVRYAHTAHALGRGHAAFLWRVKWPMLAAPIAAAFAIGFAVSVTQYLSTQFVGAGRFATVTTEALTLAAGGQRTLMAAFALLQALLPSLVFALALAIGRRQARRLGSV